MELISNLEDSCISIANSCDSLLGEFTNEDQYMVPGLDYIEKHKKKYNHSTFRPLSLTSAFTSVVPTLKDLHNLNSKRDGTAFKLQFGAKGILYSDDMKFLNNKYLEPVMCAIREGTKSSTVRIDTSNYGNFAKNYLSLFRFNFSVLNYSQICAIAGDYKSADFKGGEFDSISGGGTREVMNELLNKWDLSQYHTFSMGLYYHDKLYKGQVIKNSLGEMTYVDGTVTPGSNVGYTCRKIHGSNHNTYGIWLVDYLYNYIEYGTGSTDRSLAKSEFTNDKAEEWIDEFNILIQDGGAADKRKDDEDKKLNYRLKRVDYWISLYKLCNAGTLTSGKNLCIETLQEAGPTIIRDLNFLMNFLTTTPGVNVALLNIDGRQYDAIYLAIERINASTAAFDLDVPAYTATAGNTNSMSREARFDSVSLAMTGGWLEGENRTYNKLFEKVFERDMKNLALYLSEEYSDISGKPPERKKRKGEEGEGEEKEDPLKKEREELYTAIVAAGTEGDPSVEAKILLNKYNIPAPSSITKLWSGDKGKFPPSGRSMVRLKGGKTDAGDIYNLMDASRIGPPSGLIYTTTPMATPELLLNIISGDDIKDLMEVMTEVISSGSGDNVTATQCGQGVIIDDIIEQRGSLISMLIEKNLNPINVHAMQRFIPFANIYNYSYTFDRFVYSMYNIQMPWMDIIHAGYGLGSGEDGDRYNEHCTKPGQQIMCFKNIFQSTDPTWEPGNVRDGHWGRGNPDSTLELDISSTYYADIVKETFIRMMMDPYAHIDQFVYGLPVGRNAMGANFGPVTRMMRGFDRLGMGIPKFLSDQLLTKTLLNSMYLGAQFGPSVESSVYRWNLVEPAAYNTDFATDTSVTERTDMTATGPRVAAATGGESDGFEARRTEAKEHQTVRVHGSTGLVADVSIPRGRNIAYWPSNEQDRVLPGVEGSFGPPKITLSDSGVRPLNYGVDMLDNPAPLKSLLIVNQLPFYDPDTKQVLTYDLSKVFDLNVETAQLISPVVNENLAPKVEYPRKTQNLINMFRYEGYERFNTQLVRNVVFITNLQRMMRYSLNMWLSRAYGSVSRSHQALSAEVTERRLGDSMGITDDREYEDIQQSWI